MTKDLMALTIDPTKLIKFTPASNILLQIKYCLPSGIFSILTHHYFPLIQAVNTMNTMNTRNTFTRLRISYLKRLPSLIALSLAMHAGIAQNMVVVNNTPGIVANYKTLQGAVDSVA